MKYLSLVMTVSILAAGCTGTNPDIVLPTPMPTHSNDSSCSTKKSAQNGTSTFTTTDTTEYSQTSTDEWLWTPCGSVVSVGRGQGWHIEMTATGKLICDGPTSTCTAGLLTKWNSASPAPPKTTAGAGEFAIKERLDFYCPYNPAMSIGCQIFFKAGILFNKSHDDQAEGKVVLQNLRLVSTVQHWQAYKPQPSS